MVIMATEVMLVAGGEMTADGGVVVVVMIEDTMCMVIVLAEPLVMERHMEEDLWAVAADTLVVEAVMAAGAGAELRN
jgi:hypothetical protein